MININDLKIINYGSQLSIDVETNEGYLITSILLWKMDDFKNYSLSIDLSSYLQNINNQEILIINSSDLGLNSFEDLLFLEFESNYVDNTGCTTCQDPALGITYSLSKYYQCAIDYLIELEQENCNNCGDSSKETIITINLLIDGVYNALEIGYYDQAILLINKLKKLCAIKNCTNCPPIECSKCNNFIQS